MDFMKHNPWVCITDGYWFIREGDVCYPTGINENTIGFYIEDVGKVIWYKKRYFREITDRVNYHSDQTGDREDDI